MVNRLKRLLGINVTSIVPWSTEKTEKAEKNRTKGLVPNYVDMLCHFKETLSPSSPQN